MAEVEIIRALQQGVTAAVATSSTPSLPVAYIDRAFTAPADRKYLEVVHIPNNRVGDYWGQEKNHRGLLRLVLHWPKGDFGPYAPLTVLESVCAFFTKGLDLSGVQIYALPDYIGAIREDDEVLYPVSIRYTSYRS